MKRAFVLGLGMFVALVLLGLGCTAPTISQPTPPPAVATLPSVTDVVQRIGGSVVSITTEGVNYSYFLEPTPRRGAASGIIFSPDGSIITNNHAVDKAQKIKVLLPDGRIFDATLQGRDPFSDLAVVKIAADKLTAVTLGDSDKLEVGQSVVAIGNALDLTGSHTVTLGIISALGRSIQVGNNPILHDIIQTDAAINPGNSGGPLVTLDGEVVGINTAMIGGAENIGFAVSSATAQPVITELIKHGKIIWPWLGVDAITLTPLIASELGLTVKEGVLIQQVYTGGPLAKTGLAERDIITVLADTQTKSVKELQAVVRSHRVGEEVEIKFIQGGKTKTAKLILEQTPEHF
jgi:serine protease Do